MSGGQLWIQVDLDLNLTLALDCLVTGHHWPPLSHLSSFCTVGKRVLAHIHGPFPSPHRRSPVQGSVPVYPNSGDIRAGVPSSL